MVGQNGIARRDVMVDGIHVQVSVLRLASLSKISTLLLGCVKLCECLDVLLMCLKVPIQWEEVDVTPILKNGKTAIPDAAIASVRRNTVALKGTPLAMNIKIVLNACGTQVPSLPPVSSS